MRYFYDRVTQVEIRGVAVQRDRLQASLGYATRIPGERLRWGMLSIVVIVVMVLVCGVWCVVCGGSVAILATPMCASRSGCS